MKTLKSKIQCEIDRFLGNKKDVHGISFLKRIMSTIENHNKEITIDFAKQKIAERFSKKDWEQIKREYDIGSGISKMISFEDLMIMVAEFYKYHK